jgi:hypothetical protein
LVVSRPKIEYMKCDFNATTQKKGDVRLDVRWYPRKSPFLLGIVASKGLRYQ